MEKKSKNLDWIIAYTLHPILYPLVATLCYLIITPYFIELRQQYLIISIVFIATYIIPILLLFILKKLRLISSYHIEKPEERKFPLFLTFLISFFLGRLIYQTGLTYYLSMFFFGSSITVIICYLFVLRGIKISLHTAGISSLLGFLIGISYIFSKNLLIPIAVTFFLTGVVATNRLRLKAHSEFEVYMGIFFGLLSQLLVTIYFFYFL
ncbi:hypothetical protein [Aureivirga marina]|uniref:hypothetical protein n=1 Tax=Aureivirga marina TaxID=1182451 RepID=UPI0018C93FB7|nr:hypothetical protein [Aureivirga marina]